MKYLKFPTDMMYVIMCKLSNKSNPRHVMPSHGKFFVYLNIFYIRKPVLSEPSNDVTCSSDYMIGIHMTYRTVPAYTNP